MAGSKGILIEEHSVASLFETLNEIKAQTTRTNGRVTEIERRSIGLWVSNHQLKTFAFGLIAVCVVISDIRNPMIEFIIKLIV